MVSSLWLSLVLNLTNRLCIGISSTERYSSDPTHRHTKKKKWKKKKMRMSIMNIVVEGLFEKRDLVASTKWAAIPRCLGEGMPKETENGQTGRSHP